MASLLLAIAAGSVDAHAKELEFPGDLEALPTALPVGLPLEDVRVSMDSAHEAYIAVEGRTWVTVSEQSGFSEEVLFVLDEERGIVRWSARIHHAASMPFRDCVWLQSGSERIERRDAATGVVQERVNGMLVGATRRHVVVAVAELRAKRLRVRALDAVTGKVAATDVWHLPDALARQLDPSQEPDPLFLQPTHWPRAERIPDETGKFVDLPSDGTTTDFRHPPAVGRRYQYVIAPRLPRLHELVLWAARHPLDPAVRGPRLPEWGEPNLDILEWERWRPTNYTPVLVWASGCKHPTALLPDVLLSEYMPISRKWGIGLDRQRRLRLFHCDQAAPPRRDREDLRTSLSKWRASIFRILPRGDPRAESIPDYQDWPDRIFLQAVNWLQLPRGTIVDAFGATLSNPGELLWLSHFVCNPADKNHPDALTDAWLVYAFGRLERTPDETELREVLARESCFSPTVWRHLSQLLERTQNRSFVEAMSFPFYGWFPERELTPAAAQKFAFTWDGNDRWSIWQVLSLIGVHGAVFPSADVLPSRFAALRREWRARPVTETKSDRDEDGLDDAQDPSPDCPRSARPPQTPEQAVVQAWVVGVRSTEPILVAWSGPCRDVVHPDQPVLRAGRGEAGHRAQKGSKDGDWEMGGRRFRVWRKPDGWLAAPR